MLWMTFNSSFLAVDKRWRKFNALLNYSFAGIRSFQRLQSDKSQAKIRRWGDATFSCCFHSWSITFSVASRMPAFLKFCASRGHVLVANASIFLRCSFSRCAVSEFTTDATTVANIGMRRVLYLSTGFFQLIRSKSRVASTLGKTTFLLLAARISTSRGTWLWMVNEWVDIKQLPNR